MVTEKLIFTNTHGEKIVSLIHRVENAKGYAVIEHGLSGSKEQPHIAAIAACCAANGWTAITFDTRHTFGESDGTIAHATISSYCADLSDIIAACVPLEQKLILIGHSLGAAAVLHYTSNHPERVFALAPTSMWFSKDFYIANKLKNDAAGFHEWRTKGRLIEKVRNGVECSGRVSFDMVTDMQNLHVLESLDQLTMPLFLAVGADDINTPPEQQRLLHDLWRGPKELHVYPDCAHTFEGAAIQQLTADLAAWLAKLPS